MYHFWLSSKGNLYRPNICTILGWAAKETENVDKVEIDMGLMKLDFCGVVEDGK